MRILVTGGLGFIGSAVVRQLLEAGREVVVIVEPGTEAQNLDGLDVDRVLANILILGLIALSVYGVVAVVARAPGPSDEATWLRQVSPKDCVVLIVLRLFSQAQLTRGGRKSEVNY